MEDLDTITSQLIELDEAINTTRDAIVTADDLGSVLSRSLTIDSLSQESEVDEYINLIKDVEDELNIEELDELKDEDFEELNDFVEEEAEEDEALLRMLTEEGEE